MITIVGAGLAGLLAASLLSRRDRVVVVESQRELPNNHSALLRFRSPLVGEVTGIPFKKVRVIKSYAPWRNPVADSLAYSAKNIGEYRSDRSIGLNTEIVERWIAPSNYIKLLYLSLLKSGVAFEFGRDYGFPSGDWPVVSTIPMPALMRKLAYPVPHPSFGYVSGTNVSATIDGCDAYVSLAIPSPDLSFSRVSITGNRLIVEMPNELRLLEGEAETVVDSAAALLGVSRSQFRDVEIAEQSYAKIKPVDEEERRKFIFWASTVQGRSFSLGRFATWRPSLLLDDVVNDVHVIERLMDSPHMGYAAQKMEIDR